VTCCAISIKLRYFILYADLLIPSDNMNITAQEIFKYKRKSMNKSGSFIFFLDSNILDSTINILDISNASINYSYCI
jgi:hypothetical protein